MTASSSPATPGEVRAGSALPWAGLVARIVLAVVFIYLAGVTKVLHPEESVRAVQAYRLLPIGLSKVVGYGLPVLELALGVLVLVGLFTRWAAAGIAGLLVMFIVAIASVWARGLSIDCGCFGGGGTVAPSQTAYPSEIARDVGLLLLAGLLVWRPRTPWSVDAAQAPPVGDDFYDPDDDPEDDPDDGPGHSPRHGPGGEQEQERKGAS